MGATGNFLKNGVRIPTRKPSGNTVGMTNGSFKRAKQQVLLSTTKLNKEARAGNKLPSLRNKLISVPILVANGYMMVCRTGDEGAKVYHSTYVDILLWSETVIRGW